MQPRQDGARRQLRQWLRFHVHAGRAEVDGGGEEEFEEGVHAGAGVGVVWTAIYGRLLSETPL